MNKSSDFKHEKSLLFYWNRIEYASLYTIYIDVIE